MGRGRTCAPYLSMLACQVAYAASNVLCKLALQRGLSYLVLTAYRHVIAVFILGPLAYAAERNESHRLTRLTLTKIFLLSSLGTTIHQNVYYAGLRRTSPTAAGALSSAIPALTFLLAALLRTEKVSLGHASGRLKALGTILCAGGVLVFTFYKGYLFRSIVGRPLISMETQMPSDGADDWIMGSALILASYVAYSAWLVLQGVVCEVYPAKLTMNTLVCSFASIQSLAVALIFERNPSSWRPVWGLQLLTVIYCGTVVSVLVYYLQTWCVCERGPVFVAAFTPLLLIILGIFSAIFFAERLHLGSLLGAMLIVVGLYCVIWGRTNRSHDEIRKDDDATRG